jgi:hypothetical protein
VNEEDENNRQVAGVEKIGKDWLPLHRAPFCFFPEFGRADRLVELIRTLTSSDQGFSVIAEDDDRVLVTKDGVELVIDTTSGEFAIRPAEPEDEFDQVMTGMDDPFGRPDEFFEALGAEQPTPAFKNGVEGLGELAQRIWRALCRRFDTAITTGSATVFGRWRQLDAPFTKVYPDQWYQFDIETITNRNDHFGEYGVHSRLVRDGEIIHSVHVRPNKTVARSKSSPIEEKARLRLVAMMREAPDKPAPRPDVWLIFQSDFKRLSHEGFKRVWRDAIELAPAPRWAMPGRRREDKSPKSKGPSNNVTKISLPKR